MCQHRRLLQAAADGSGTAFYNRTRYQPPRGDYHVYEDSGGGQWYAIPGVAAVERKPVYQDGSLRLYPPRSRRLPSRL